MVSAADILIVGLGQTGLSVARFLARQGLPFAVADSRMEPPGLAELRAECPQAAVHLGPFEAELFVGFRTLVVSPGIAVAELAVQAAAAAGAEILGDIELFARHVKAPIIAITGSNGKSTVTTLVGELLAAAGHKVRVGGNLGTPALDLLAGEPAEFYVLELSSFQLETTSSLKAAAAVVLNVSEDHMDRYLSLAAYAKAKGRIYRHAAAAVVNREDAWSLRLAASTGVTQPVSFGLDAPAPGHWGLIEHDGQIWLAYGDRPLVRECELTLRGRHNMANALAALALVEAVGVDPAAVLDALRGFAGLPHRSQFVGHFHGLDWVNDSKGTNVGATAAALAGQTAPVVLIAGGQGKGQDFTVLRPLLTAKARGVVLIGQDADLIEAAWAGGVPIVRAKDMGEAVLMAAELGRPGDVVLLSPACASFDMFKNYAHRGEVFAAEVRRRFGT
ncbi:MAG: UDP-N-acetylmuramoyl-L-alanine--D-glutamate ligase [Gammaproteobacteria bacterium]|nr:UDP-N-acetylmuramoyl-L-alanine--D-glutamate ligase [Gammaproteobacteria bacterium]